MCPSLAHAIVEQGGQALHCGKTGCLETDASPMAICEDFGRISPRADTAALSALTGETPEPRDRR
jgi:predicted NBD/HSP70 family sugar kinase